MLKYLPALILIISLVGCGSESEPAFDDAPAENPMGQMQESAPVQDVSDNELQAFVDVSMEAQEVQSESQLEMMTIVEEEGIDVETYNQIAQGLQMGQSEQDMDVSSEDMDKFNSASESIGEVEQEMEEKVAGIAEDEGLNMERFQEINVAIQQDPQLQQRAQQMMQESQMQPAPQPDNY